MSASIVYVDLQTLEKLSFGISKVAAKFIVSTFSDCEPAKLYEALIYILFKNMDSAYNEPGKLWCEHVGTTVYGDKNYYLPTDARTYSLEEIRHWFDGPNIEAPTRDNIYHLARLAYHHASYNVRNEKKGLSAAGIIAELSSRLQH